MLRYHRAICCQLLVTLMAMGCSPASKPVTETEDIKARPDKPNTTSPFEFDLPGDSDDQTLPTIDSIRLVDVAKDQAVQHTFVNGEEGEALMVEATGGGCGWGDFDRDGQWDLFVNQAGDLKKPIDDSQPNDALFRNVGGRFENATEGARIEDRYYGQGVAVADYDNDGFDDIYVTNFGRNTLWHNMGDGTFEEVAEPAGLADSRWSTSAAWADLDLDGDLDLYVCNYLQYDPLTSKECRNPGGEIRACHPREFDHWPDECYINQGDGTFTAEAKQRGLFGKGNKALGVAVADFNQDGLPDIYVANDTEANFMFINQGDARFVDDAPVLGCAASRTGANQASMGLAIADIDRDGWLDIYVSHYESESNTLYKSLGQAGYDDITADVGLHQLTLKSLGFGVVAVDLNASGIYEFYVGNGHIENFPDNPRHRMRSQVLAIEEGVKWQDITDSVSDYLTAKRVTRGVAKCDFDNDGDVDISVIQQNDPVGLLRNDSDQGHWIKLQFLGVENNRRGIGCRVTVRCGDEQWMQELHGGGSYNVSHQPMLNFGLGDATGPCDIEIRWPNGQKQVLRQLDADQEYQIVED